MKKFILFTLFVILITVIIICNYNNSSHQIEEVTLTPAKIIKLKVPEPSGLYLDEHEKSLWTVSDENSTIYQLDLLGNILKQITIDGFDLEGITKINNSTLVTILERERVVVFLDTNGAEIKRINIDLTGEPNKGLEGITFNQTSKNLYIVNEKDPGVMVEIDTLGNVISSKILGLSSDYSGLDYNEKDEELWIISDEGEAVFKCDEDGTLITKYILNIEQMEGIAVNPNKSQIYVISDPLETLYIFDLK